MKKRIAIFVVLAMVLCLALTGCGQSDKRTEGTGNVVENGRDDGFDFDTGDSSIMDGTNNPSGDSEDYPLGNDESIPDGGAEWEATHGGDKSYSVVGYTITLRTDLDDYIDGNFFLFDKLATDLGWRPRTPENAGNPDLMRYFYGDNNEYEVGFDSPLKQYYCHIYGSNGATDSSGRFRFSEGSIDSHGPTYWVNRGGTMYTNYDQIVLLTYLLENTREAQNSDDLSAGLPTSGDLY